MRNIDIFLICGILKTLLSTHFASKPSQPCVIWLAFPAPQWLSSSSRKAQVSYKTISITSLFFVPQTCVYGSLFNTFLRYQIQTLLFVDPYLFIRLIFDISQIFKICAAIFSGNTDFLCKTVFLCNMFNLYPFQHGTIIGYFQSNYLSST